MNRQQHADNLLEHYEQPRHHGPLPDADVITTGDNPGCGDVMTIYLQVGPGDVAQKIQFEAEGCTISQGAASILMEMVQGKPLAEIEALDYNDLIEVLGKDVVLTRVRCAILSLSTLKKAIGQYQARQLQPAQR